MWWQNFRDQGLVAVLCRYAVLSVALSALAYFLPYITGSENTISVSTWLAFAWLAIVIRGTFVCGWPGLILWLPIYWALFWPGIFVAIFIACWFGACV